MFLSTLDKTCRLLVEQSGTDSRDSSKFVLSLPEVGDVSSISRIDAWMSEIGVKRTSTPEYFNFRLNTHEAEMQFVACSGEDVSKNTENGFRLGKANARYMWISIESLWRQEIDESLAAAATQIVRQAETIEPESLQRLESSFVAEFNLKKINPRVFFSKSETVEVTESLISFLGAFSACRGEQTARLCMHQSQSETIQEMLMIHAVATKTGPLRQNNDSSVSYHMIRGALEITLHRGGDIGDDVYRVERINGRPASKGAIRVPARVFRTIRTLTDSAVFIEVQSGPFSDSDTEWEDD